MPPGQGVSMGIRQSDDELRATFNAAIDSMKADGSLNALLVQWFGETRAAVRVIRLPAGPPPAAPARARCSASAPTPRSCRNGSGSPVT
jgi:hypothetical protein